VPAAADVAEIGGGAAPRPGLMHQGERPGLGLRCVAVLRRAHRPPAGILLGGPCGVGGSRARTTTHATWVPRTLGLAPGHHHTVPSPRRAQRTAPVGGGGPLRAVSHERYAMGGAIRATKSAPPYWRGAQTNSGGDLLSQALAGQVPSALRGLTTLFGKGRGVTPSP
jgi:hypothetical protein